MKSRTYKKIMQSIFEAVQKSQSLPNKRKQILLKRVAVTMLPIHPAVARAKQRKKINDSPVIAPGMVQS